MTNSADTPVGLRKLVKGLAIVATETQLVEFRDGAPITITSGPATGDVVYVKSSDSYLTQGGGQHYHAQADRFEHPEHGAVVSYYIDMARLTEAPYLLARERRLLGAARDAARDNYGVPACDNCGNCRLCV